MKEPRRSIVGTWQLRSWTAFAGDGTASEPFGREPCGLLVYAADGTMITVITPSPHSDSDRSAAACFAYAGRYEVGDGVVVHLVEASCRPEWVGTRQTRRLDLDDHRTTLTLTSGPLDLGGATRVHRLVWERRSSPEQDEDRRAEGGAVRGAERRRRGPLG